MISEQKGRDGETERGGEERFELTNRLVGFFALSAKLHVWMDQCYLSLISSYSMEALEAA